MYFDACIKTIKQNKVNPLKLFGFSPTIYKINLLIKLNSVPVSR